MIDDDIRAFYQRPWVMVGSDGGINARHPRGAGTFPRVLGRYVRDERWLTLPEAIRKMTRMPADRLKLTDRGRLETGAAGDVVLFNPATVIDRSTFSDPMTLPAGVENVFVGGELVWDGGKPAPGRAGVVITTGRSQAGRAGRASLAGQAGRGPGRSGLAGRFAAGLDDWN
jgi:N-acyl-D-aspartate/D-glutamate deacylase